MTGSPPMTKARVRILAVGVPLTLALIALCTRGWVNAAVTTLAHVQQVSTRVAFSAPTGPAGVNLTANDSNVRLGTGPGDRIRVRGTLTGGLVAPVPGHRLTGSGLTLSPRCRSPISGCSFDYTVTAPTGQPVAIKDWFGQLTVDGINSDVTLSDDSGDISASRLTGAVRLSDSFGNIDASQLTGRTKLTSNSGDINASGLTGNTQISTSFGNVTVNGISADDVRCTGQSSDITIAFTRVPRTVQVNDSFGNVTLKLPPGDTRYDVSTRNPFGNTKVTVPRSSTAPDVITVIDNSGSILIS